MPYWVTISLEGMRYTKEHAHSIKKASRRLLGALSTEARRQLGDLSLSNLISPEVLRLPLIFLDEESKDSFLANFNYRVGHHLAVDPQVNGDLHLTKMGIFLYLQFLNQDYKLP